MDSVQGPWWDVRDPGQSPGHPWFSRGSSLGSPSVQGRWDVGPSRPPPATPPLDSSEPDACDLPSSSTVVSPTQVFPPFLEDMWAPLRAWGSVQGAGVGARTGGGGGGGKTSEDREGRPTWRRSALLSENPLVPVTKLPTPPRWRGCGTRGLGGLPWSNGISMVLTQRRPKPHGLSPAEPGGASGRHLSVSGNTLAVLRGGPTAAGPGGVPAPCVPPAQH